MHLINFKELSGQDIDVMVDLGVEVKHNPIKYCKTLEGKTSALIFQKTSTQKNAGFFLRLQPLSLAVTAYLLIGAQPNFTMADITDEVQYLSRNVEFIMARLLYDVDLLKITKASRVPVVNGCVPASPRKMRAFGKLCGQEADAGARERELRDGDTVGAARDARPRESGERDGCQPADHAVHVVEEVDRVHQRDQRHQRQRAGDANGQPEAGHHAAREQHGSGGGLAEHLDRGPHAEAVVPQAQGERDAGTEEEVIRLPLAGACEVKRIATAHTPSATAKTPAPPSSAVAEVCSLRASGWSR